MFRSKKALEETKKTSMKNTSSEEGSGTPLENIQLFPNLNVKEPQCPISSNQSIQMSNPLPNYSSLVDTFSSFHSQLQHLGPNFSCFQPLPIQPNAHQEGSMLDSSHVKSNPLLAFLQNLNSQGQSFQPHIVHQDQTLSPSCDSSKIRPSSSGNIQEQEKQKSTTTTPFSSNVSDDEESDDEESEVKSNYEVKITDATGSIRKKKNMKVMDVMKMQDGERVMVEINERGQPIRSARKVLTRWMTLHVRQPNLCPPDAKDFHEVRKISGIQLLRIVREKFLFPNHDNVDNVLMALFNAKFRNNRYRTIKRLFHDAKNQLDNKARISLKDAGYDDEEIEKTMKNSQYSYEDLEKELSNLPCLPGYSNHQWLKLLAYIKSDFYKSLSAKGKEARATQSHLHTTGTKSFAQVEDEQVLKKKRKLGFIEFFDVTHKRKDGTYVKDESELLMKAAREKIEELQANEPSKDQQALESEAWTYYMGDDRPGRARGFGTGVTKTQVNGFRADLMKMRYQESNQNCLRAELQNLHNKLAEQKQMFDQHVAMTNQTIGQLQSELYLYRIAFGAQMHPTTFGMFCGNPMAGSTYPANVSNAPNMQDPRSTSGGGENALTGDSLT